MVFKNDKNKLSKYIKNYILRLSLIYCFSILFNVIIFIFIVPRIRPDFAGVRIPLGIAFICLAIFCGIMLFIGQNKFKKSFLNYSCEIDDNLITIYENGMKKTYGITELSNIYETSKKKYKLVFKNKSVLFISDSLENIEEFQKILFSIKTPKQTIVSNRIYNLLSWIFCIGFFISRFIPNLYVWFFFAIGFVITSIISTYKILVMNVKTWIKIYQVLFYIIIDGLIINAMITVLKTIFA